MFSHDKLGRKRKGNRLWSKEPKNITMKVSQQEKELLLKKRSEQ